MQFANQEFGAIARFQRVSPQKARLVLDLIKGRRVEDALNTLAFTKKGVAPAIEKLLRSALQNATYVSDEKGLDVDVDRLYVKRAVANDAPRLKRIRPAPMGRAFRYQRRMTHLEIALAEKAIVRQGHAHNDAEAAPVAQEASAAAGKKKVPAKKKIAAKTAPKKDAKSKSSGKSKK